MSRSAAEELKSSIQLGSYLIERITNALRQGPPQVLSDAVEAPDKTVKYKKSVIKDDHSVAEELEFFDDAMKAVENVESRYEQAPVGPVE